MSNELAIIKKTLNSDETINAMVLAGAFKSEKEGRAEALKYISGILMEFERTEGTNFKLSICTADSVRRAVIDSIRYKIPIDGRKMAHIDVRFNNFTKKNEAFLQIDTNGFVAKISEHYPDFHIKATPVFDGDDLEILDDGKVLHRQRNVFCSDPAKLSGVIVQVSYTKGKRFIEEAVPVSKHDLMAMKKLSRNNDKETNVWNSWAIERMKTAAIKRVCKWHFRQIQGIQDIIDYDNQMNYDVENYKQDQKEPLLNKINNIVNHDGNNNPNLIDVEQADDVIDIDALKEVGFSKAKEGMQSLKDWGASLTDKEKESVVQYRDQMASIAKEVEDNKNKSKNGIIVF